MITQHLRFWDTVILGVGGVTIGFIAWKMWTRSRSGVTGQSYPSKEKFVYVGKVTKLYVYPIKSCKGILTESAICTKLGLYHSGFNKDRVFLVTESNGHFITARQEPRMVLIVPSFHDNELWLDGPNMETGKFDISKVTQTKRTRCRVWGEKMMAYDCGPEVSAWLSKYLARQDIKLFYFPDMESPRVPRDHDKWEMLKSTDNSVFADNTAYMLMTTSSVADLNERISKKAPVEQFRPNIIVEGCDPYAEEKWKYIRIGEEAHFRNSRLCTRCIFITIDPETGVKDDIEPLKTLKGYKQIKDPILRKCEGDSPIFGIHMSADKFGTIKVGDPVYAVS